MKYTHTFSLLGTAFALAVLLSLGTSYSAEAQAIQIPTSPTDLPGNGAVQFVKTVLDTSGYHPQATIDGFLPVMGIDWLPGSDNAGYFVLSGEPTNTFGTTGCRYGLWLIGESGGSLLDERDPFIDATTPARLNEGNSFDCSHITINSTEGVRLSDDTLMFQMAGAQAGGEGYTNGGNRGGVSTYRVGPSGLSFTAFIESTGFSWTPAVPYANGNLLSNFPAPKSLLSAPGGVVQTTFSNNPFRGYAPNNTPAVRGSNLGNFVLVNNGDEIDRLDIYEFTENDVVYRGDVEELRGSNYPVFLYGRDNADPNIGWILFYRNNGLHLARLEASADDVSAEVFDIETYMPQDMISATTKTGSLSAAGEFVVVGYNYATTIGNTLERHRYFVVYKNGEAYAAVDLGGGDSSQPVLVEISPNGTIVVEKKFNTFDMYRINDVPRGNTGGNNTNNIPVIDGGANQVGPGEVQIGGRSALDFLRQIIDALRTNRSR